jgi:flagellar basal-body rod protein FlgF
MLIETRDKQIGSKNFRKELGTMVFGVGVDENKTYFSQGILEDTGRNLDFAINGTGFFTVVNDNGEERYTRDGRFVINSEGLLTTIEGHLVLGINSDGSKVPIKITGSDVSLSADGVIENSTEQVKFNLSGFNSESDLIKEGTNYFKSQVEPLGEASGIVEQKKLEKANVDAIEAITDMISIMRSYESNQKVIQQMDETLGKTVNEVGSIR